MQRFQFMNPLGLLLQCPSSHITASPMFTYFIPQNLGSLLCFNWKWFETLCFLYAWSVVKSFTCNHNCNQCLVNFRPQSHYLNWHKTTWIPLLYFYLLDFLRNIRGLVEDNAVKDWSRLQLWHIIENDKGCFLLCSKSHQI